MVAEIYGGISAFKAMFDLAKGIKDINDATLRNSAVIKLQEKILAAQAAQANLIERIRELETQVTELEEWEAQKDRYQMVEIPPGVIIYTLKEECVAPGEPVHSICPTCYGNRKRFPLHKSEITNGQYKLTCHSCKTVYPVGIHTRPLQTRAITSGRRGSAWSA